MAIPVQASFEFLCEASPLPDELTDIVDDHSALAIYQFEPSADERSYMKIVEPLTQTIDVKTEDNGDRSINIVWHDEFGTTCVMYGIYDDSENHGTWIDVCSQCGDRVTLSLPIYEMLPLWIAKHGASAFQLYPGGILSIVNKGYFRIG